MAVRGASGETDPGTWGGGLMSDPYSSSRCSGTRMLRWTALVVPAAVVLTGSFGASAFAAVGGNAAAPTVTGNSSSADANHGVGNGVGNGNDKHEDATTTTTTTATTADASTSNSASSTASHQVDCKATPTDPLCSAQPLSNADQNTG